MWGCKCDPELNDSYVTVTVRRCESFENGEVDRFKREGGRRGSERLCVRSARCPRFDFSYEGTVCVRVEEAWFGLVCGDQIGWC